jgi:PAS domain S-box-containing protein
VALTYYTNAAWRRHDTEDAERLALLLARHAATHQERATKNTHEQHWIENVLAGARSLPETAVTVIDPNGIIVARDPGGEAWVGRSVSDAPSFWTMVGDGRSEGTTVASDLDGEQKLLAFRSLGEEGNGRKFTIVVGVPLADAFADADVILNRSLVALGIIGIGIIFLAWVGSDAVVLRPVKCLLGVTQRLRAGDLGARSGMSKGSDEMCQLAGALDDMATELERRHAETKIAEAALLTANEALEKRVRERTAHLVVANEAQQIALRDLKRVEDNLRESQAQLAGVIESAMEAMITVDEDRRVILFNRAAEQIFRLPAAEAIGRPLDRFVPERYRAELEAGLRALGPAGTVGNRIGVAGPAFGLRADGEEFPIEAAVSLAEVRGENLYTITVRDISERLKTEDLLRKFSLAVEKTTESVIVTNRKGVIEYVNGSFEELTGYRREEAIGKTPAILKSGHHDTAFYADLWERILSGNVFSAVFLNRKKNGETYYEERSITPIRGDGQNVTHFVATGRDITQRKRTEEALRRLNTQLEREAERIAHALHDEAGQFLTSAHITLADVARDIPDAAQSRLREVREHLVVIEEQLRRLSHELRPRILDDLGLAAALEFLADGVMKRTGIVVTTEVALEKRLPQVVETTLYRLTQEALTNAAKHARPSKIHVLVNRDAGTIQCVIRDDGVGFDAAEAFGRHGDPSLGLVGTRDRVEALGGTLGITSIRGNGTKLLCQIPAGSTEP